MDMWDHRNNIKHNTITPQIQTEMEQIQQHLDAEATIGTTGMLVKDHYLIISIPTTLHMSLHAQKLLLHSISLARQASQASIPQATPSLLQQQHNLADFLNR